jgi:thymidine phosphorylase
VGVIVHYKVGEYVEAGTPLFTVHANDEDKLDAAEARLLAAHAFSDDPVEPYPLFYRRVSSSAILRRMRQA